MATFLFAIYSFSQETLYLETFTGQELKGAEGAIPNVDLSGVTWDIDFSTATLSSDYRFRVVANKGLPLFEARNVGSSTWLSPPVDISDHTDIAFSLGVSQRNLTLEITDTVTTQYRIDGGTWTNASTNGALSGNNTVQVSQAGLSGSTIEIRVIFVNDDNDDRQRIDNIEVTGLPIPVTYVFDNGWLPSNPIGVSSLIDDIIVVEGTVNFNANTNCNNLIVNPEGNVTVDSGITLTVDNEMVFESSSTRYASLISDGTITGTALYKRHINGASGTGALSGSNDLVSAPLTGQTFLDFRTDNTNIASGIIGGTFTYLFGPFSTGTGAYKNYTAADNGSTLDAGIGYRTGSTDNSTYTFTGTIETGNVPVLIGPGRASSWNLIGNPYTSYLKVQDFLNNMLTSGLINENAVGLYGYDGDVTDGWVIYNLATTTASTVIAPGQGFFVNAEGTGNVQFTPNMRTTGTDDDFIPLRASNSLVYLKLNMSNTTKEAVTDFYFNANASLALDPGYDASVWNNTPSNFSIYSHLVDGNLGKAMSLQALHSDDLLNVTIPLGVKANTSSDIVFTISESTLPETINVYLEDTVNNSTTLLNNENYVLSPNAAINGTGRFYLRLVDAQLNISELELESLNIFANQSEKSIVVEGLLQHQTSLEIYDVQGRIVVNSNLKLNTSKQSIDVSQLTSGVYIVKTQSNSISKAKKVMLE